MKLGVNARRLAGQRLGVARYIEYLIRHWAAMALPFERVDLFVREPLNGHDLPPSRVLTIRPVSPRLTGLLWENLSLPWQARGVDVLYCPSYTVPLTYPGRCVLAIHSLNEAYSGTHPWWYRLTYGQLYKLSARKADVVIVPSMSVKDDLQRVYRIPGSKIEVIPLGVDDAFRPIDDGDLLRATRIRYLGADRPYILFVGKLSRRRNIPVLLRAFAALKQRNSLPHSLLLVGPNHLGLPLREMATELGIADSLVQIDGQFADHRELVPLYNAADLFVSASSYEGFSLPLLEAMACGVAVVTVNRSALAEIAGDGAVLIDEPTAEAVAEAMHRVLDSRDLQAELRVKGVRRAHAFRWESTAQRTLEVLARVARGVAPSVVRAEV